MPSSAKIFCVPPTMVGDAWPACGEWLLRGLAECSDMGVLETIDKCRDGSFQLWMIGDVQGAESLGACVTEIIEADGDRVVALYALAGKRLHEWSDDFADAITKFATAEGCRAVRFVGRKGWARTIKDAKKVGDMQGLAVYERAA